MSKRLQLIAMALGLLIVVGTFPRVSAQATPGVITSSPLSITTYDSGLMAVQYDGREQFFGTRAGGTWTRVDGRLYGAQPPAWAGSILPENYRTVSNGVVVGNGTELSPFRTVTVYRAGEIEIIQTTSYIAGRSYYDISYSVINLGSTSHNVTLLHAGDLYLNFEGNSRDMGVGFRDVQTGAVGARSQDGQNVQVFIPYPSYPPSGWQEGVFNVIWQAVAQGTLNNTFLPTYHDTGAALSYVRTLSPGESSQIELRGAFGLSVDVPVPTPTKTASPTASSTPTATLTSTPLPPGLPSPTATRVPTSTPTATATGVPTAISIVSFSAEGTKVRFSAFEYNTTSYKVEVVRGGAPIDKREILAKGSMNGLAATYELAFVTMAPGDTVVLYEKEINSQTWIYRATVHATQEMGEKAYLPYVER